MKRRASTASIIAATFGSSTSDISEYRYQPTRTKQAIYTIGPYYFAVGQQAPKDDVGVPWEKYSDQFWAAKANTTLWVAKSVELTRTSSKQIV